MKTYTFTKGSESMTFERMTYDEALSDLISAVGGEAEAALWIYRGE